MESMKGPRESSSQLSASPVRPRDRLVTDLSARPHAATAADVASEGRRLRSGPGPAVLHPLGPLAALLSPNGALMPRGDGDRYRCQSKPGKLEPSCQPMHAGRDGFAPDDGARARFEDALGAVV